MKNFDAYYSDDYYYDKHLEREIQDADKVRCRECDKFIGYGPKYGPLCFECKMQEQEEWEEANGQFGVGS